MMTNPWGQLVGVRRVENSTEYLATIISGSSISFKQRVILFHAATLSDMGQLVERGGGFKEIYKERPGELIFSAKSRLALRKYKK